jgi:hypothetical protein
MILYALLLKLHCHQLLHRVKVPKALGPFFDVAVHVSLDNLWRVFENGPMLLVNYLG